MSDPLPSVMLIAARLNGSRGGQERSIVEYADCLIELGHEVSVIAGEPPAEHHHRFRFVPLELPGGRAPKGVAEVLATANLAAKKHRGTHIVQSMLPTFEAHIYLPRGGLYAEAHRRSASARSSILGRLGARLVGSFNTDRQLLRKTEAAILQHPKGPLLVALSSYVARQAQFHHGIEESRICVVRNGVTVDPGRLAGIDMAAQRRLRGIDDQAVVFLAVAHNHRLKGIPQLVRAARRLSGAQPYEVLVLGGPARSADRAGRVRFLGSVDDALPDLVMADVLVHPTFYDPSSRVVLEALTVGTPVITTRWNGASDFLEEGGGIVLDEADDIAALAAAMSSYMDPEKRARDAAAATELGPDVSMARHAKMMSALFRKLSPG